MKMIIPALGIIIVIIVAAFAFMLQPAGLEKMPEKTPEPTPETGAEDLSDLLDDRLDEAFEELEEADFSIPI